MMLACHHIRDDFGVFRVRDTWLEYANDRRGATIKVSKANCFPEDGGIFLESLRPESIRQDNGAGRVGPIVLRSDETAEYRMKSHYVEVRPTDYASLYLARLAQTDHGEADGGEISNRAQAFYACPKILDLRHAKCRVVVTDPRGALPEVDQAVLVAVDQGFEQDAAHQRENGGVRTDAQSQRQDDSQRHPPSTPERVKCHPQIANK